MGRGGGLPAGVVLAVAAEAKNAGTQVAHELEKTLIRHTGTAQGICGARRITRALSKASEALSGGGDLQAEADRKSTRLNSSHMSISYAVFCLKKKNNNKHT